MYLILKLIRIHILPSLPKQSFENRELCPSSSSRSFKTRAQNCLTVPLDTYFMVLLSNVIVYSQRLYFLYLDLSIFQSLIIKDKLLERC